jgi:hypothetical protein
MSMLLILNWLCLLCVIFLSILVILSFLDLIIILDGILLVILTFLLSFGVYFLVFVILLLVQVGCFINLALYFLFDGLWYEILLGIIILIIFIDIIILVFNDLFWLNWSASLLDFSILVDYFLVLNDLCLLFFHIDVLLCFLDHFWDLFFVFFSIYWSFNCLIFDFWSFLNSFNGINNLCRSLLDWTFSLRLGLLSR